MATKQKAKVDDKKIIKKEKVLDETEKLFKVKFIIPVHSPEKDIIFERGKIYKLTEAELKVYKGDYIKC